MAGGGFWQIPDWNLEGVLGFFWDLAKAAVPAGVAWVAYKVSVEAKEATQAQKDIAANQYLISLYDVRRSSLSKLTTWLKSNENKTLGKLDRNSDIPDIIQEIKETYCIELNVRDIDKKISGILAEELQASALDDLAEREHCPWSAAAKDLIAEAARHRALHADLQRLFVDDLENIVLECRAKLKVPDQPYRS